MRKTCARDVARLKAEVAAELELHAGYAARWDAPLDGPDFEPSAATADYVAFLGDLAGDADRSAAEVVAGMAPCMDLYHEIGKALKAAGGADPANPYAEWVETYASPDFGHARARIDELLDDLVRAAEKNNDHDLVKDIPKLYAKALTLEKAFFAAQTLAPTYEADNADFVAKLKNRGPEL